MEADSNYTHIYLANNKKILVARLLKEYEELLEKFGYLRTHQSFLINVDHVSRYNKVDNSILMTNGSEIPISRRNKDDFLKQMGLI